MFYDRKIKYLEDRKDGERIRTAGFVKAEVRGDVCRMSIHVSGLYGTDSFEKSILVLGGGREGKLCDIKIAGGKGDTGELCFQSGQLGRAGISYGELEEIRIPLAAGRELRCLWKKKEEAMSKVRVSQNQTESEEISVVSSAVTMAGSPENNERSNDKRSNEESASENILGSPEESASEDILRSAEESAEENPVKSTMTAPEAALKAPFMEDKWNQLCVIYPHIAPFQDEREYLSIEPQDFVIFPVKYYQLVNNSFLLHGYHNYQHLILTRILYRGEIRYYIGVPGNYYEKEKQVAVMFGFESFECKAEPAQTGDYGYYMMRIAL